MGGTSTRTPTANSFTATGATTLLYPYNIEQTQNSGYHGHAHEFDGVLKALLLNPESFSIEGVEEYYSAQEIKLIHMLQEKVGSEIKRAE